GNPSVGSNPTSTPNEQARSARSVGEGAEEGSDVAGEQVGDFEGGEVAAGAEFGPAGDVVRLFCEGADGEVGGGEHRDPGGHGAFERGREHGGVVEPLVVVVGDAASGAGEPVNAGRGQDGVPA